MSGKQTPAWVGITYVIYCSVWITVVIGGAGYAVFVLGHSGWWMLAGVLLAGCGYSPWRWHCICTGIEVPYQRDFSKDEHEPAPSTPVQTGEAG